MDAEEAKKVVEAAIARGLAKKSEPQPEPEAEDANPEPLPVVVQPAKAPAPKPVDIEVTAEQPQEMEQCQRSLIQWAQDKLLSIGADMSELQESFDMAVKNRWKSSTLKRQLDKAKAEVCYYTKMLAAFEAGYVLVPNMPGAIFAVRTDKVCPTGAWKYSYYEASQQPARTSLPVGEGEYVARENKVREHQHTDSAGQVIRRSYCATDFGELEFPFAMAKPRIMEATSRAMALRLFDEFMILPKEAAPRTGGAQTVTRCDPIILGVIARRFGATVEKKASFMIAWHINTRDL